MDPLPGAVSLIGGSQAGAVITVIELANGDEAIPVRLPLELASTVRADWRRVFALEGIEIPKSATVP